MKRPPIESAGAFRARYLARGAVPGLLGSLMIVGYFAGTLDLGPEGWRAFGAIRNGGPLACRFATE